MMESILSYKENYKVVGRAATAIYLILKCEEIKKSEVLVPANICYAAIYPIIYSDNIPVFCDVDAETGNMCLHIIKEICSNKNIKAMIIPHMYGNPVEDINLIKKLCDDNNILLIEDCASAMGAYVDKKPVGTFGDYAIYSTGYAKLIDLGHGGIVTSNRKMDTINEEYNKLADFDIEIEKNELFFSRLYRLIRNDKEQTISSYIYQGLLNNIKNMFLFRIDKSFEEKVISSIENIEIEILKRKEAFQEYEILLKFNKYMKRYHYLDGAVPWRYNILVEKNIKMKLIKFLLEKKVPVSDWYPVVTEMFGDEGVYINAKKMEDRIINFPLILSKKEIEIIAYNVNLFFEEIL